MTCLATASHTGEGSELIDEWVGPCRQPSETPAGAGVWYHCGTVSPVAMNLRLTEAETEALRAKATEEGRSMQDVARDAIAQYVSDRPRRLRSAISKVKTEDAELLERLAQ